MNVLEKRRFLESRYGIKYVDRPHIKATKALDLHGIQGRDIVEQETKRVLETHKATLEKLALM